VRPRRDPDPATTLESLEQLGPRLAHDLRAVGIPDPDALRATGTDEANRRLVEAGLQAGMHSLQAMPGPPAGDRQGPRPLAARAGRLRRSPGPSPAWRRGPLRARPTSSPDGPRHLPDRRVHGRGPHGFARADVSGHRPSSGRSLGFRFSIHRHRGSAPEVNVTYRHGGRSPGFPGPRLHCCPSMGAQRSALREKGAEPRQGPGIDHAIR